MALWARTQQLTGHYLRQLQELYTPRFPMDVRHSIAEWLEAQNWKSIDDNSDEAMASYMLEQMDQEIREKANRDDLFPHRLRLLESASEIKKAYQDNPLELVRLIRSSLMIEEQLVMMSCGEPSKQDTHVSQNEWLILSEMGTLRNAVMQTGTLAKQLLQKHESFVLWLQHNKKIEERLRILDTHPDSPQKQQQKKKFEAEKAQMHSSLQEGARQMSEHRKMMVTHMRSIITSFQRISNMIFDVELVNWKTLQKQSTFKSDLCEAHVLNKIQRWCEEFATLLNDCKQQVMKLQLLESEIPLNQQEINELNMGLMELLKLLLLKSFVVDRQPPQVVRKDARFAACVRLLVGHKLNLFMTMPMVEAMIISEPQARQIVKDGFIPSNMDNAGDILNHRCSMEFTQGQMTVNFKNMQLKKIKRADRKGQELVVEEKFCILFRAKIQADREYDIWTMSMPVVVTVHGNQECQAQATILWDNAFSEPNRVPFAVPDQVLWKDLATLLSCWFKHTTGSGLTLDHLHYLAAKLFGEGAADYSNNQITRSQFHKDHLQPGKWNFTFWEWLYLVQKLTREYLRQLWVDGLIMGFVSKKHAQDLLMSRPPGTFLLRFSDTELGGISIVYNCVEPGTDKIQVCNLLPFTDKDFRIRCLPDRVKDLQVLWTLYPDIPKERAFGKYWAQSNDTVQQANPLDYIQHTLSMTIPGMPQASGTQPMSPVSTIQQPMSNMTANSMDTDYQDDDLSSYLSPAANTDFTNDDLADVMINRYLH